MSIVGDFRQARKLAQARCQPSLSFLGFSLDAVLAEIRANIFPEIQHAISIDFVARGPLACIAVDDGRAHIYLHQLLNHSEIPAHVFSWILTHELLHLRIPPRTVDGKEKQHPPEFCSAARALCPQRQKSWEWVWNNFDGCLRRRPRLERIDVRPNWKQCWGRLPANLAGQHRF